MTSNFLSRLNRWLKKQGMDPVASRWVGVAEAHRSGWPHMNLVLVSKGLAAHLRAERKGLEFDGVQGRALMLARGELADHVLGAGWGPQSTMEVARSKGALAGYLVKLAGELDKDGDAESRGRVVGEVAKLTQVPLNAPLNFRRLRSGRGFLPPRRKGEHTGAMLAEFSALGVPHAYDLEPERRARAREVLAALDTLEATGRSPFAPSKVEHRETPPAEGPKIGVILRDSG